MKKRLTVLALAAALLLSFAWTVSALSAQSAVPDKDIQLDAENTNARGAWSDGTTIWVTDYVDGKIYAYDLAANTRAATKDFTGVASPRNIWSDGTTMWVTGMTATVRAYKMSDKSRDAAKDIDASVCKNFVGALRGIWSDGTTMYVAATYPRNENLCLQNERQDLRRDEDIRRTRFRRHDPSRGHLVRRHDHVGGGIQ